MLVTLFKLLLLFLILLLGILTLESVFFLLALFHVSHSGMVLSLMNLIQFTSSQKKTDVLSSFNNTRKHFNMMLRIPYVSK